MNCISRTNDRIIKLICTLATAIFFQLQIDFFLNLDSQRLPSKTWCSRELEYRRCFGLRWRITGYGSAAGFSFNSSISVFWKSKSFTSVGILYNICTTLTFVVREASIGGRWKIKGKHSQLSERFVLPEADNSQCLRHLCSDSCHIQQQRVKLTFLLPKMEIQSWLRSFVF